MNKKNKYYELWLPYFKQGDDLHSQWKPRDGKERTSKEAFLAHASLLEAAASQLKKVAEHTGRGLRIIDADTHYIGVECPEDLGEVLVKEGLLSPEPFEDEDLG